MQAQIVKWGNSQGIRIPKAFLQSIQVAENDPVDLVLEDEKIVIKKSKGNPIKHKTTRERLIEFYGEDFEKHKDDVDREVIDWGPPVGEEIW